MVRPDFPELNFPAFDFRTRKDNAGMSIFDVCRRRWVSLSPEEWVRQHFIHYLLTIAEVPQALIAVEKKIMVLGMERRFDIVVYRSLQQPVMLIECKAPTVKIDQKVIDQAGRYNISLKLPLLCVSNGMEHICCQRTADAWVFLDHIPHFKMMAEGIS